MQKLFSSLLLCVKQRSFQVLFVLILYFATAHLLPLSIHQVLYTISTCIKDLLIWILPITVSFFIADAICCFQRKAALFIGTIIFFEILSNLGSVWYALSGAHFVSHFFSPLQSPEIYLKFDPLWKIPLIQPTWWSADKGTYVGVALGFWGAFSKHPFLQQILHKGKENCQWILSQFFARLIPIFILGFVARMVQTELISHLFAHYGLLLLWLIFFLVLYLSFLFILGSGFRWFRAIKNISSAAGIAFTSGCSVSTMPWTIEGTAKNLKDPSLAKAVIPLTTNIQQIGDCIVNSFLCFLIYKHFYGHDPHFVTLLSFSLAFVLARFATVAVIGGAIFIMLPVYESYLSFHAEMIAIVLAFNVVLDPIITCCNVIANGALCRIFERIWNLRSSIKTKKETTKSSDSL